jgi:hypothetical protein
MTVTLPTLTTLREWCHSFMAILGVVSIVYGGVVETLKTAGWVLPTQYATQVAGFGVLLLTASKAIDSLNNALTNIGSGAQPIPAVAAQPGIPPGAVG